jgi:hypothetical protein
MLETSRPRQILVKGNAMATVTATPKARKQEPRTAHLTTIGTVRVLWLSVGKLTTAYQLESIPSDFGTAYRLSKADYGDGAPEVYDVNIDLLSGRHTCECKGNLRWNHCKHVDSLLTLINTRRIEAHTPKPQPAPEPLVLDDL